MKSKLAVGQTTTNATDLDNLPTGAIIQEVTPGEESSTYQHNVDGLWDAHFKTSTIDLLTLSCSPEYQVLYLPGEDEQPPTSPRLPADYTFMSAPVLQRCSILMSYMAAATNPCWPLWKRVAIARTLSSQAADWADQEAHTNPTPTTTQPTPGPGPRPGPPTDPDLDAVSQFAAALAGIAHQASRNQPVTARHVRSLALCAQHYYRHLNNQLRKEHHHEHASVHPAPVA